MQLCSIPPPPPPPLYGVVPHDAKPAGGKVIKIETSTKNKTKFIPPAAAKPRDAAQKIMNDGWLCASNVPLANQGNTPPKTPRKSQDR